LQVKKFSGMGRLGRSAFSTPLFILGPLHIFETNRAGKLKLGTLVDIYECRAIKTCPLGGIW